MNKRIAFVGAGAIGGYVGTNLAALGHDVTLIDPWPAHVEAIRANGMHLYGMTEAENRTVRVNTLHVTEVQQLAKQQPVDIAFIAVKSYDTVWATRTDSPVSVAGRLRRVVAELHQRGTHRGCGWLGPDGRLRGWRRCGVELFEPGHVRRTMLENSECRIISCRRAAWPDHAPHRGTRRHVGRHRYRACD